MLRMGDYLIGFRVRFRLSPINFKFTKRIKYIKYLNRTEVLFEIEYIINIPTWYGKKTAIKKEWIDWDTFIIVYKPFPISENIITCN